MAEWFSGSSEPITMNSVTQKTVPLCFNISCLKPCSLSMGCTFFRFAMSSMPVYLYLVSFLWYP
jgi:hypothetical protein